MPPVVEGLPAFIAYFALGAGLLAAFSYVYIRLTAHDEIGLVRAGNSAAAITLSAAVIGLALPIAAAIENTQSIVAAGVWSLIGCLVQLGAYGVSRLVIDDQPGRIERGEIAPAVLTGAISIAAALLNAACMTY
jgi:putative membrane protein